MLRGRDSKHLTVLGGGPAGLAVAYYANKRGLACQLYEAAHHAYPVLDFGAELAAERVPAHLGRFENLDLLGRNGLFRYTWLHGVMRMGRDLVDAVSA